MKSVLLPFSMMLLSIVSYSQSTSSSNITLLSNWAPDSIIQYNDIWGYQSCDGHEYALLGSRSAIHFMDLADPTLPVEVASFAGGQNTTWRDIKTFRNRAYAVSDNTSEGLMIFDMSGLPDAVEKTYHGNTLFENAHNIFIDEQHGRMYIVGSSAGNLLIFDLTADLDNPTLIKNISLPGGYIHDLYVKNHIAYCSHLSAGMYVYDLSDPENVVTLGSVTDYLGTVFNHSSWLSEDGETLIMCDETHGAPVKVADVSDLSDITVPAEKMFSSALEAPTATNSIAHNPLIRDDHVFISYYHDGVQVYNISNTDSIYRVAYFDTNTDNTNYNGFLGCWGVYPFLSSGTIIASDINNGLFVLSMDNMDLEPNIDDIIPNADVALLNGPVFCEGDSAILSANFQAGVTYSWSKDNDLLPFDGNQLVITSPGMYKLEVFNGICNAYSEETVIEFAEKPDLTTMVGETVNLCVGENYMIEAPSGLDYYLWMRDGNVLSNTNNVIQAVQSGVYTLLAYQNGCPAFSEPYEVSVLELPEATLNTMQDIPCGDEEIMLITEAGASAYGWYKDGNLYQTTEDPFLFVNENGTYSVTLSIANCSESSDDFILDIQPVPDNEIVLSGMPTLCEGESVVLQADENADAWSWLFDGEEISTAPAIEVHNTGLYELIVTNASGCSVMNQQYIEVIILETPTIVLQNGVLTSTNSDFYQWYLNGAAIPGATNNQYTPTENGIYGVEISNTIGCSSTSESIELTTVSVDTPAGLENVAIYPNPVTNYLQVEINSDFGQTINLRLFHANGQLIQQNQINAISTFSTTLEMSDLATGVYFLQVINENGSLLQKVVKE